MIRLLLRRGADPSHSDWPLPILALSVRAGDQHMVELLLKKKVQVNCQLSSTRLASLTPLHIACGCLSSNSVEIARQLLEHGANVNAESSSGYKEYFSLIDPLILETNKIVKSIFFSALFILNFRMKNNNMVEHLYISHVRVKKHQIH